MPMDYSIKTGTGQGGTHNPLKICAPVLGLWEESHLGGAVYDFHNLKGLAALGMEVHIPVVYHLECRQQPGWKIYRIPLRRGYKVGPILVNLFFFIWVVRIWKKTRFHILMVRSPEYLGYFSWLVHRLFPVKTVGLYCHLERENRVQRWFNQKIAHSFSFIVVPSQFTKRQLMGRYRLPEEKIGVVYHGVPESLLTSEKAGNPSVLKEMPLDGKKVLLYVGALSARKNLFFLLDVFEEAKKEHPDILLILCGGRAHPKDRYDMRLRSEVKKRELEESVLFSGERTSLEKTALFHRADIFVFPSLLEGFGFSVSEAMATGKPIVCSNRASLPELIENEVTGLLADADDPAAFAAQLGRLLEDGVLCRRLGENARLVAEKRFTWHRSSEQFSEFFKELLSQGGRP